MGGATEREELEVDVLFVGAGPASLSSALHLSHLIERHNDSLSSGTGSAPRLDPTILVIEKGKEVGAHALSGAVVDPRAFQELLEGIPGVEPPSYDCPVEKDSLHFLTEKSSYRLPITPPPLGNHGCYLASLGDLVRWLERLCQARGVEVYPGFAAAQLLIDSGQVTGVRMMDSGVDRDGNRKPNYEPGIEVKAKVTVLGEGPRGTLAQQAIAALDLAGTSQPQLFALGVKELWRVPRVREGQVFHTLGYPLGRSEFGGGFIYTMKSNLVSLGFVVGLDYSDPSTDGHALLQRFKSHPFARSLIEGGELISYGAKAIPEGGYCAMPRLCAPGLLLTGDSAGFLNSQRLKGIHLAVKSGMLAAESIFQALLKQDFSDRGLAGYQRSFEDSWARRELWRVRNFRQSFQRGFWPGLFHSAAQFLTGGRGLIDPMPIRAGHSLMKRLGPAGTLPAEPAFDGVISFDKLRCLYYSDTAHEEDQPAHLKVLEPSLCDSKCRHEYGNPCQHFCPAGVYEMIQEAASNQLRINFSNCVHCKTCEIMDPYQIILWTPPEGGGGPGWKRM